MKKKTKITVLFVDDHPLLQEGFVSSMSDSDDIDVIKVIDNAEEVLPVFKKYKPNVIVMDIKLRGKMNGLDAIKSVMRYDRKANIVVFTQYDHDRTIADAYALGIRAFVTKGHKSSDLRTCIREAAKGKEFFLADIARRLITRKESEDLINNLTENEITIIKMRASGKNNEQIANKINISPRTVATYVNKIKEKFNIKSNADLVKFAIENKILSDDDD